MTAMRAANDDDGIAAAIEVLNRIERSIMTVVMDAGGESYIPRLTEALHDLSSVRLHIEGPDRHGQRSHGRTQRQATAILETAAGACIDVSLRDISAGGALIESDTIIASDTRTVLHIAGVPWGIPGVSRASRDGRTHLAFAQLPPERLLLFLKHLDQIFLRY